MPPPLSCLRFAVTPKANVLRLPVKMRELAPGAPNQSRAGTPERPRELRHLLLRMLPAHGVAAGGGELVTAERGSGPGSP